jgi:hypothetical protein
MEATDRCYGYIKSQTCAFCTPGRFATLRVGSACQLQLFLSPHCCCYSACSSWSACLPWMRPSTRATLGGSLSPGPHPVGPRGRVQEGHLWQEQGQLQQQVQGWGRPMGEQRVTCWETWVSDVMVLRRVMLLDWFCWVPQSLGHLKAAVVIVCL